MGNQMQCTEAQVGYKERQVGYKADLVGCKGGQNQD
jgi:hypothetical protein